MGATLASTMLGFAREVINARYYGTQWQMDVFLAAAVIPTILFGLFNGALVSALVPVFSEYLARDGEHEAWRLASTVINMLFICLTACAALGYVFAPTYVPLIAHGFTPGHMAVAIRMTRWLMPSIIAVSLSGVLTAILNADRRFKAAALTGVALNVVTIGAVILFNRSLGIYALVLGTAIGLGAQLLIQVPAFLLAGKYRLTIDVRHPGLARIGAVLGPILIGSAAGQTALFFDRYFASSLSPGYISGMNYATKLVNFPQQVFAAAIATVIFPLLASQFAQSNKAMVASSVSTGLRLVNFITIPSVCALILLAHPLVQTLFERGVFQATATQLCAHLLPFAAVGLVALAANVVLTRCAFACKETSWAVAISVIAVLLNIVLSLVWLPSLGARGLLLANSVSQTVQAMLLLILVSRVVRAIEWGPIAIAAIRVIAASAVMAGVLHWIAALGAHPGDFFVARAWFLTGQVAIGMLAFLAAARVLGVEEIGLVIRLLVQRFERNVPSAPEGGEAPIA